MKTISLKEAKENVTLNGLDQEINATTTDLLKIAINSPVQGGYTPSDMYLRVNLLSLVDQAIKEKSKTISFEDEQFKALSKIVNETRWQIVSKFILEFIQDFTENKQ